MPKRRLITELHCWGLAAMWLICAAGAHAAGQDKTSGGSVARGMFSTQIVDREPVDQVLVLSNDVKEIFFFTELKHLTGQTITHQWQYEGKTVSEKKFEVSGARWRVYSKRTLDPSMTGEWVVMVNDERGWPLYAAKFNYVKKQPGEDNSAILPLP